MREWGQAHNAKVEAVIGVGKVIWQIVTGELGFAAIAKMAWQAIIAMLPPVLIRILIEKLVAIIVPAAGALMAIVEGLQAAWGTISSIITALERFIAFLKAVKGGGAGPQFAAALASAAIVVLDFVANFLIAKLGSGLKKLAGKLGGIAKRLIRKKKSAGGRSSRKSRRRKDRPGAGRRRRRGAPKPRRGRSKTERPPARGRAGKPRKRSEADRRKELEAKKHKRLSRAVAAIRPTAESMLNRGTSKPILKARLLYWRVRYRLTRLSLLSGGLIEAVVNPRAPIARAEELRAIGAALEPILQRAEAAFLAERRKRLSTRESRTETSARQAVEGRNKEPLKLGRFAQIQLFRDIRAGKVKAGQFLTLYPDFDKRIRIFLRNPRNTGTLFEHGILPRGAQINGRKLGGSYNDIMHVLQHHPSLVAWDRLLNLVNVVEPTRFPGMIPANSVNEGLVMEGLATREEITAGALNPMTAPSSARATEREFHGSQATFSRSKEQEILHAEEVRQQALGASFERLRSLLRHPRADIVQKPGGHALERLAKAFERWLNAAFPVGKNAVKSDEEVRRAVRRLEGRLIVFLKTFK